MDLDLQGNIEKFTLPEIFQLIAAARKSGTLGIQREESIVMIYFSQGDIIYGYGPRQTYHLGQLLRDRGILSAEQLEEAVSTQARTENSRRLGEILITRGFIDRADLIRVVQEQVERLLYSLLSWQSGSFKFYENQYPTDEEITVRLSVENVILEGLRRLDEETMAAEALGDFSTVYTISASQGGRPRTVSMEADEWNVMALVDGHRSIEQIVATSPFDRTATLRGLARLRLAGIITPRGRADISKTADRAHTGEIEQMISRLAGLFEQYLSNRPAPKATVSRVTSEVLTGEPDAAN